MSSTLEFPDKQISTQIPISIPISIPIKDYLIACLSFRYIANATIITSLIAYYTNAYYIFFITIPLMITNFIIILLVQWFNMPELLSAVFSNKSNIDYNNVVFDDTSIFKFVILNILWHLIPLLWLYNVLHKDNLIDIFTPNFMGIFLICCIISIFYFYYASKMNIYGNINYIWYGALYMLILFICCITIFNNKSN